MLEIELTTENLDEVQKGQQNKNNPSADITREEEEKGNVWTVVGNVRNTLRRKRVMWKKMNEVRRSVV